MLEQEKYKMFGKNKWIIIIKNEEEDYYDQFVGLAFPVIRKSNDDSMGVCLPIKSIEEDNEEILLKDRESWWDKKEIRPTTKEEKIEGILRLGAEML